MSFVKLHQARVVEAVRADPGVPGHALCDAITHEVDTLVLRSLAAALRDTGIGTTLPPGAALTALGGYGRRQMSLRSDIDLQLVVPEDFGDPEPLMRALLAPLMAARLRLGHGVRTTSESWELARAEPTFATAVLTSRHLAGDPTITERVRSAVYRDLAGPGLERMVSFLDRGRASRAARR